MKTTNNKPMSDVMQANLGLLPLIMNNIPQAVFWKNHDLVYMGCNQAFADDAGFSSPAEIVGKTDFDMPWNAQAELYRADDSAVMEKGEPKINYEEPQTTPSGSTIWLSTSKIPVHENGQVVAVLGMYEDITARKQGENAIHESEERFRRFAEATVEGLVFHEQGKIIDANPASLAMLGLTDNAEFIGRNLLEFIAPEFHKAVLQNMQVDITHSHEMECIRKDGTIFPVENVTRTYKVGDKIIRASSIRDITERKEAARVLLENEQRFRALFESANDAIFTMREDKIIDVNSKTLEIFKLESRDQIIGHSVGKFSPEFQPDGVSSAQKVGERIILALQGETQFFEWKHIHGDGTPFDAEISLNRLEAGGEILFQAIVRDITERKQAENELQREKIFSDAVINGLAGIFFLFDTQGKLFRWNEEYERVLGYNTSELATINAMDPIADEDKEKTVAAIGRAYAEGQGSIESVVVTKDGRQIPFHFVARRVQLGGQLYMAGTGLDITDRKQAEETLQESRQLLQLVMDNIPQSVFWKDAQLNYLGCNRAFAADVALASPSDVIGLTDFDFPSADRAEYYRADDSIVMNSGIPKINFEESQTTPDGTTNWLRTSKIPMRDADGKVFAMLGLYEDITEQKRLQRSVQDLFERRGYQVQVGTEISQEVASASELSDLFSRVVMLTKERLGYYHTQLLRYDTHRDAVVLINGYGEIGQKMLASGHQMPMGEGLIGTAAATGETVLRPTLADDPDWRPNPLLPETRGEIAVPIKWQNMVLGVLDVQSNQAGALNDEDRLLFEGLCGQIAIAMHNAELVETVRQNEARLAEALRAARLAHWEYDVEKDIFTFNDQFYSIFHTTAEKVGGYQLSSSRYSELFVHPDDLPMVGTEIGKALSSTERVYNTTIDHRILYADGGIGYITVKVTVERDENGKITRYYGANQDVTELKQSEAALRQSEQEMAERLEELNHLYRNMSHEGWKTYRETAEFPAGFMFDQTGTRPVEEVALVDENLASVPLKVLGGEVLGTLAVASDPRNPTSTEDIAFIQKVSNQIALALESARLTTQTQSALAQSERLFEASRILTQSADLQELTAKVVGLLGIPAINRAILATFDFDAQNNVVGMDIVANWWNGTGHEVTAVGAHYSQDMILAMSFFVSPTPVFFNDTHTDERVDTNAMKLVERQNLRAVAILPLYTGTRQNGALILEGEEPHNFTQDETRLFMALAPQISTILENRLQFEQAQQQAEREAMLNTISQKIQSATSVEAVLQIAARELGRALDASKAVAQLSAFKRNGGNGNNGNGHHQ